MSLFCSAVVFAIYSPVPRNSQTGPMHWNVEGQQMKTNTTYTGKVIRIMSSSLTFVSVLSRKWRSSTSQSRQCYLCAANTVEDNSLVILLDIRWAWLPGYLDGQLTDHVKEVVPIEGVRAGVQVPTGVSTYLWSWWIALSLHPDELQAETRWSNKVIYLYSAFSLFCHFVYSHTHRGQNNLHGDKCVWPSPFLF